MKAHKTKAPRAVTREAIIQSKLIALRHDHTAARSQALRSLARLGNLRFHPRTIAIVLFLALLPACDVVATAPTVALTNRQMPKGQHANDMEAAQ